MKYSSVFEAMRDKASGRLNWEAANCGDGIDATIEALKEMRVGEPIRGHILHFPHDDKPWTPATHFRATGSHSSLALANGLIDSDGEEVVVMVFRTK